MLTIKLSPLDSRVASVIADSRNMTVDALIASLLREEAAIEVSRLRKSTDENELSDSLNHAPTVPTAQQTQGAKHDGEN